MKNFLFLNLLIYALIFAGLAGLNGGVLVLAIPLLVYVAVAVLYKPETASLKIERRLSAEHISPAEPVVVRLMVANEGPALAEVYIEDLIPPSLTLVEGEAAVLTTLHPHETIGLTYTLHGDRGSYYFPGVRVTTRDRFALFTRQETLPATSQLLVLPEVVKLRRVEIRPAQTRIYAGTIPTRQGGPGVEFFGVRAYQPGDPLRWINSRATARHAWNIFINEFRQERMIDVGLILDARRRSNVVSETGALFEYAVQATAALANEFLNAGNRVGLFIYGNTLDWTYPGYGKIQRRRILLALAREKPSQSQVFANLEHLPAKLFPARSQLVFLSPLLPDDARVLISLRARDYRLLVVSPDPIDFESRRLGWGASQTSANRDKAGGIQGDISPAARTFPNFETSSVGEKNDIQMAIRIARLERALLLDKLRQAGIRVMDWQVETPFQEAAHATLSRFRRKW